MWNLATNPRLRTKLKWADEQRGTEPKKIGKYCPLYGTTWQYNTSCAETWSEIPITFFLVAKSHHVLHSRSLCRSGDSLGFSKNWYLYCLSLTWNAFPLGDPCPDRCIPTGKVHYLSKLIPIDSMVFSLFPSLPTPSWLLAVCFYLHLPSTSDSGQGMVCWLKVYILQGGWKNYLSAN